MTFRQFNKINTILSHHPELEILLQEYTDDGDITVDRFDSDTDIEDIFEMIKKHPNAEMVIFDGDFTKEINWDEF